MNEPQRAQPFCSVIVPTRRRPENLARCLDAITELDYPRDRFEVIVVDDGGGIPLGPVVERFRGPLRLSLLVQQRATGPAAARNAGVSQAEGELLAFTDDDCRFAPDWLRIVAGRYRAEPERAFGGHTVNMLVRNPYASTSQLVLDVGYAFLNSGSDTARFFTTNNLAVPASLFRLLGGLDPDYLTAEDRDFCARWLARGWKLTYVPEAVVYHASRLTFSSFCRQHFAYGRGARQYHLAQARRSNRKVPIDASYYRALAFAPFRGERPAGAFAVATLLLVWHFTNTAGFLWEWLRPRRGVAATPACRVLHLAWSGRVGGIERHLAAVVRRACEGDPGAAHVLLLDGRGAVGDELSAEGLATPLGLRRGWGPVGLWRLARTLRRIRPALVHLHTHAIGPLVVSALALRGTPRVYTEHFPRALQPENRKFRVLYRIVRRSCDRVVALAPVMAHAIEQRGIDPRRIAVIPNAVAVAPGRAADRRRVATIGVVARLVPSKRVDLLIDVVAELRRRGVDCSAVIVGDGPERAALERHAAADGTADRIQFVGEQADVTAWLDRLDVFLMTSPVEIYSVAALEAMARGVPVVALACNGGLADLAARGGLLLPDRKPSTAAAAVARLLGSDEEQDQLRARGHRVAAGHGVEAILSKLEELYSAVQTERPARPTTRDSPVRLEPAE